jgi:hypothetical protein
VSPAAVVNENMLDDWVRGHAEKAKGTIPELIYRLVSVACPRPRERRFPLGDSLDVNARGVHTFTSGRAEREIAQIYRERAEAVDLAGYPRLGGAVRAVAESFERDAERDESRDPFEN